MTPEVSGMGQILIPYRNETLALMPKNVAELTMSVSYYTILKY